MRPRLLRLSATLVVAIVLAGCSGSATGGLTISGAWARPGVAGGVSAAYLVIIGGPSADALLSASSPGAATVELHETSTDGSGMTGMHPLASLAVPAGATVTLKPGSYHLMIMGLRQTVAVGDTLQLDLVFERAGKVVVKAEVKEA